MRLRWIAEGNEIPTSVRLARRDGLKSDGDHYQKRPIQSPIRVH